MSIINHQMTSGAIWMILFKFLERSIGLISTIILARLLIPADFGLVAMATAIMAVLELLGSFSFDIALIQNQNANRHHYDTAWTLNVILACFYTILLCLLAHPASLFYNEPRLEPVMYCLSLGQFINGFENIGVIAFRKELRFSREFRLLLIKKVVSFTMTIYLAFLLRNYWALVVGTLTGRLASLLITYLVHPYRPRFCLVKRTELFHFSKWLLVNNLVYFFTNKFTDFVIGKVVGMNALGIYTISYEFSNLPTTEIVSPINRALLPGYSQLAGNPNQLKLSYLAGTGIISLLSLPTGFGLAAIAEPFVLTILGTKWLEVIPLFQLLAINGIVNALGSTLSPLCLALGRPKILTMVGIMYAGILVPCLITGAIMNGTLGAVIGMVIAHFFTTPIGWWMVLRQVQIRLSSLLMVFWRPFFASLIMAFSVNYFLSALQNLTPYDIALYIPYSISTMQIQTILLLLSSPISHLALGTLVGFLTYLIILLILWRISGKPNSAEVQVMNYIKRNISNFF